LSAETPAQHTHTARHHALAGDTAATLGFERLAKVTAMPSKSLHRMLSPKGNPSMDNLAAIFGAVRKRLKVDLKAHTDRRQL